jgi:effector-binding domain-containing protein
MIETPYITQTSEQHIAKLHLTVPRENIGGSMGAGVQEVLSVLTAQNIAPTGPWFTHHNRRPTDTFDFEICFPVAQSIAPSGQVVPGTWPSMTVARTVFQGNYSGLPEAWGEFHAWLDANAHKTADDLWEVYLVNPHANPNPAEWRTELNRQIID